MNRRNVSVVLLLSFLAVGCDSSPLTDTDNEPASFELKQRVVVLRAAPRSKGNTGDVFKPGDVVVVEAIKNQRLSVATGGGKQWISREHVIPLDGADEKITAMLESDTNDVTLLKARGKLRLFLNDFKIAWEDFDKAIKLRPDADIYVGRGRCWIHKGEPENAVADFSKAIQLSPKLADAYYYRGMMQIDDAAGLLDLDSALKLNPKYGDAYVALANRLERLSRHKAAMENYNEWIHQLPSDAKAYQRRGLLHKDLEEHAEALQDLTQSIKLDPDDSDVFLHRGRVQEALGMNNAALQDYEKALELNPAPRATYNSRCSVLVSRGYLLHRMGQHTEALEDHNEAVRLRPWSQYYLHRGALLQSQGKHAEAILDFGKAIEGDSQDEAYVGRIKSRIVTGEFPSALEDCNTLIQRSPKLAAAYHYRGELHVKLSQLEEAIRDYSEALQLDPSLEQTRARRAWILATCDDSDLRNGKQAVADAKILCESFKWKDAASLAVLSAAYAADNDFTNAIKYFKQAKEIDADVVEKHSSDMLEAYSAGKPYIESASSQAGDSPPEPANQAG